MTSMRAPAVVLAIAVLCAGQASGQTTGQASGQVTTGQASGQVTTGQASGRVTTGAAAAPQASQVGQAPPPTAAEDLARKWAFSASAFGYFLVDDDDFFMPTVTADRGWLHLEARYNYEALDAGSAWLGFNFAGGKKVEWTFTPMIGGVFGATDGIAPGYKGSLGWRKLELYSEGEYVFDAGDSANNFFYNWSELTYAPTEWFRFGIVGQRTRVYQTERDIQRGLLVAFTYKRLDVAGYVFNPDDSKPIVVVALRIEF
jgi:hypothetical protein